MIGQTISHYRILERLGAGGMGVVYKAQDIRLDRPVALKFLPHDLDQGAQVLERFRREAHAASNLNHPNICTIHDVGEQDGQPFIAMEYIDGETLSRHIHGQPLQLAEVLELGIQIADALDAAHTQGIVHRDIKPANIFVTKRGQAKVLDFGLAKLVGRPAVGGEHPDSPGGVAEEPVSIVGVISGTPSYMSPEQVRGDDLDARTDIFSLGLLLYEMATGRKAFGGNTGGAIIESILMKAPASVSSVNPEMPANLESIINKALEKDRDRRYHSAAEIRADLQSLKREVETGHTAATVYNFPAARRSRWKIIAPVAAAIVIALGIGGWFYRVHHARTLSETDTIVLADFANSTGDPVFDDTLRQGLVVQLEQSPFLSLISEVRIQETLQMMGQPGEARLSPTIARDVCQRTGSKAYLSGSIASLGNQFVIGLKAVNCNTGDLLVEEQVQAAGKEKVLDALGQAASKMRAKLGESLSSVEKLDTPIEQASTPSLEALQDYSLGRKTMMNKGDYPAAVSLFQRAIQLDPKFAMAYASIGTAYHNLGESNSAVENTQKAYELRDRVSQREKFYIESHYHNYVTGDLETTLQAYQLWEQSYPRDSIPPNNSGQVFQNLGQYEKALEETRAAFRLAPGDGLTYGNVVTAYVNLDRYQEAHNAAEEALSKKLGTSDIHLELYIMAFFQNDAAGMARQVAWGMGRPGDEAAMAYMESETAAYFGQLGKAREFSRNAALSATRIDQKETVADYEAAEALVEGLFGNAGEAKQRVAASLALSNGHDAEFVAALGLAFAGDAAAMAQGEKLADDLAKRFPQDTLIQSICLPAIRGQLALDRNDAPKAIALLQAASAYELGYPGTDTFSHNLYPVYVRGDAYLAAHQGEQAASEFQRILDHRGVVGNEPIGSLARLGMARALALEAAAAAPADSAAAKAKAGAAYNEFFVLWKNADPGLPILQQARAEAAKLK
jgi:serine/threonine protein kinase/tetratricopeptide (TPR) repeat protein